MGARRGEEKLLDNGAAAAGAAVSSVIADAMYW